MVQLCLGCHGFGLGLDGDLVECVVFKLIGELKNYNTLPARRTILIFKKVTRQYLVSVSLFIKNKALETRRHDTIKLAKKALLGIASRGSSARRPALIGNTAIRRMVILRRKRVS